MSEQISFNRDSKDIQERFNNIVDTHPILRKLIREYGRQILDNERPERCRAIVFNPTIDKILSIERNRPDREVYMVYPGGGLEDYDDMAISGAYRELNEELGLDKSQVYLSDNIIDLNGEFFFIGVARDEFEDLSIGGPEAKKDPAIAGTYTPKWINIFKLEEENMFPIEVTQLISSSAK